MNHISFRLEADVGPVNHILIDGQPLPYSGWLDWYDVLNSLEQSGYYEILSCSCGEAACAGLYPVVVFHVDGMIAWYVNQRGYRERFCFDARQMKQAIQEALEVLDWLHFFHCDENECHCPSTEFTETVLGHYRWKSTLWGWDGSVVGTEEDATPTSKLLAAICRGDLDGVIYWADAGADTNHVSAMWSYGELLHSVLQTALLFAPKAVMLPILKILLSKGADIYHAMRACPEFIRDMLAAGNTDTRLYLAALIHEDASPDEFERRYLDGMWKTGVR